MPSEQNATEKVAENVGGLAFKFGWKEPDEEAAKKRPSSPPSNKGTPTLDVIKEKLVKAEERRKSFETSRLENIAKHNTEKIKLAQTKVQEISEAFVQEAKLGLEKKMSKVEDNQKANEQLRDRKFKEMNEHLKQVRERKKEMGANGDCSPTDE